jgi:hypothetical protein
MLSLALNITGSYEGHEGWANLAENFDGQGLSMGLLNQNLGQGTLQPMWAEMNVSYPSQMKSSFTSAHLSSLLAMLTQWQGTVKAAALDVSDYGYSELDDPNEIARELGLDPAELEEIHAALTSRNQKAVDWATKNLYTKGDFKSDWHAQLQNLAVTAGYRSIQIRRAEGLHAKAMEMLRTFQLKELRSYAFLFDIAVQNGGMSTSVRSKYATWLKANPKASETSRLNQLLTLRLATVIKKYVTDVKSRKQAIINGIGVVHSKSRNFEKEYCVELSTPVG